MRAGIVSGLSVICLIVVAACGSAAPLPTGQASQATGSPSKSAPAKCDQQTCRFGDDVLAFDYPASWHTATFDVVSSFSTDLVYLSTAPLSDPCDRTPSSVACVRLAATALGTDGVLVTWRLRAWPGWTFDPGQGSHLAVGRRQASLVAGLPSDACRAIAGEREIIVTIPSTAPDNWAELDACLAGPDPSAANDQVDAMLATVVWTN
jgi:hypothetical protein